MLFCLFHPPISLSQRIAYLYKKHQKIRRQRYENVLLKAMAKMRFETKAINKKEFEGIS